MKTRAPWLLALALSVLAACTHERDDQRSHGPSSVTEAADARPQQKVGLGFERGAALHDDGPTVTSAKVKLVCDGFPEDAAGQHVIDLASGGALTVFDAPTGCTLRLLEFTYGEQVFTPKPGHGFTTWLKGDEAVFTNGALELILVVKHQLPSPLHGDHKVVYEFKSLVRKDKEIGNVDISVEHVKLQIDGIPAPQFHVERARITAFTPLALGLELEVECNEAMLGADLDHATCAGEKLETMKALLLQNPSAEHSIGQMLGLFETTPGKKVGELSRFQFVPYHGFTFEVPFAALGLTSLDDLNTKELLFALSQKGKGSVLYAILKKTPKAGCIDHAAANFDPFATTDDGSCVVPPACADRATFDWHAPADNDCDGVSDTADQCPATPVKATVDALGCTPREVADDDGDGVKNYKDLCVSVAPFDGLGADGCTTADLADDDSDGIKNHLDRCRASAPGVNVDATGCFPASFADVDGDGVPNTLDQCPRTGQGDAVDSVGCVATAQLIDADHDGVPDQRDRCANTTGTAGADGCSLTDVLALTPAADDTVGTIKGELSVTPSGDANYSIDLAQPPGTAGMEPRLALVYSSSGGNGMVGYGVNLQGLSQIKRCPSNINRNGFTGQAGVTMTKFCLDGQILVAVSGVYGADGTQYRTEKESFSKITSFGNASGFPTSFKVETKGGRTMTYGATTDSVVPHADGSPFVWALSETKDRRGNYMTYEYVLDLEDREQVPSKIRYTGNATAGVTPYYEIRFSYYEFGDVDLFRPISYRDGFMRKQTRTLTHVETYSLVESKSVRKYSLVYDGGPHNLLQLATVTECREGVCLPATKLTWDMQQSYAYTPVSISFEASELPKRSHEKRHEDFADVNQDGQIDFVYIPDGYSDLYVCYGQRQVDGGYAFSRPFRVMEHDTYLINSPDGRHDRIIDVDGDGRVDRLWVYDDTHVYVAKGQGNSFAAVPTLWLAPNVPAMSKDGEHWNVADVNGDGFKDLVWIPSNKEDIYVALNKGTSGPGFNQPTVWLTTTARHAYSDFGADEQLIDLNGDNKADYVWVNAGTGELRVALSSGTGFNLGEYLINLGFTAKADKGAGKLVDVNGDGHVDRVWIPEGQTSLYVALGEGNGLFATATKWLTTSLSSTAELDHFVDLNNDGMLDLVFMPNNGNGSVNQQIYGALSSGASFELLSQFGWNGSAAVPVEFETQGFAMDIDGDGFTDRLWYDVSENLHLATYNHELNRVTKVVNGIGRETQIAYVLPNSNSIARYSDAVFPAVNARVGRPLVGKVTERETDGTAMTRGYFYAGYALHALGLGSLGFRYVDEYQEADLTLTHTVYSQAFQAYAQGEVELMDKRVYDNDGNQFIVEEIRRQFGFRFIGSGSATRVYTAPSLVQTRRFEAKAGALPYSVENVATTYVPNDEQGNIAKVVRTLFDRYGQTVVTRELSYAPGGCACGDDGVAAVVETQVNPDGETFSQEMRFPSYNAFGENTREVRLAGGSELTLDYTYDVFGHRVSTTTTGPNIAQRTESNEYGADGRFMVKKTDALGRVSTYAHAAHLGLPVKSVEPSGRAELVAYSVYGQTKAIVHPDGSYTRTVIQACANTAECEAGELYLVRSTKSGGETVTAFMDLWNRQVRARQTVLLGKIAEQRNAYERGRLAGSTNPYLLGENGIWETRTYDQLGRITAVYKGLDDPNLVLTTTREYDGAVVKTINAKGQTKTEVYDALGLLREVTDTNGTKVTHKYGIGKRLLETVTESGTIKVGYDADGRRASTSDPDFGKRLFGYDALGQLITTTNARDQVTCYEYDLLGRMTKRVDDCTSDGADDRTSLWTYDAVNGKVTRIESKDYIRTIQYDARDRVAQVDTKIHDEKLSYALSYDMYGRLERMTYPTGFHAYNTFDTAGHIVEIRGDDGKLLWAATDGDGRGNVTKFRHGNGIETTVAIEQARGLLNSVKYAGAADTLYDQHYQYDDLGNMTQRSWEATGFAAVETFDYDALNRLTQATYADGMPSQSVAYDAMGNITSKSGIGTYTYGAACSGGFAGPHAVSSVSGGKNATYCYDADGNLTRGDGRELEWTAFNLPSRIETQGGDSVVMSYDANRALMRRIDAGQVARTTFYLDNLYEKVYENGTYSHRFRIQDQVVVVRGADGVPHQNYLHRDNLGSIVAITDQDAKVLAYTAYDAWGRKLSYSWVKLAAASPTERGYTDQLHLEAIGLVHMNGRMYDPELGRMLGADPYVQAPSVTQNYNRYSYVLNNPLRLTDPSGFNIFDDIGDFFEDDVGGFFTDTVGGFFANTIPTFFTETVWGGLVVAYDHTFGDDEFNRWFTLAAGILEIGGGIALCVGTGGAACAIAALLILHGIDAIVSSAVGLKVGDDYVTGTTYALTLTGLSADDAALVDAGVFLVLDIAGGVAASKAATNAAKAAGTASRTANAAGSAASAARSGAKVERSARAIQGARSALLLEKALSPFTEYRALRYLTKIVGATQLLFGDLPNAFKGVYRIGDAAGEDLQAPLGDALNGAR